MEQQKQLFERNDHICPRHIETCFPGEAHWRLDNTCSFCGSLNHNTFMSIVQEGCIIIPTDKNYKVYLNPTEDNYRDYVLPKRPKFYFQHLTEGMMHEFVSLYNDKKLNIGFPGYFYRLPFFMRKNDP